MGNVNGEVLGFIDLVKKHKIEIPIIQRDYAQGRSENEGILTDFLKALKTSIVEEKKIKLDFIYGELVGDSFQPLDGQQRLTTLFLLHWYAIVSEKTDYESFSKLLSKFTYETRLSSRDFCDYLVKNPVCISNETKVSESIRDTSWFYLSWEQDPSIKAMLNTLDAIQENFQDVPNLRELLIDQKLITFHYLNLQDLGLSDDLYIKMNARGKLLTPFENLKAQIQMKIENEKWEATQMKVENEKWEATQMKIESVKLEATPDFADKFSYKIDTTWTDFFWKEFRENIDTAHISFISTIIMFKIALDKNNKKRFNYIKEINDNSNGKFLFQFINKDVFDYICVCYELLSENKYSDTDLSIDEIPFWSHNCKKSVLDDIVYDPSYTKKALLFAQIEFLRRTKKFDREAYIMWMRVIRNFVCHADVTISRKSSRQDLLRSPESFSGMINLIYALADGCDDIYSFFSNQKTTSNFQKDQMNEEILKAKKIIENSQLREIIWKFEDLILFRGRISFVFYCVNNMPNLESSSELEKLELLYKDVFYPYFFDEDSFDHVLFNRAMLTIKVENEQPYYSEWWSSYWQAIDAPKYKFIFSLTELNRYIYKEKSNRITNSGSSYLIELVLILLKNNYDDLLNNYKSPENMPNWKVQLIKAPKWIKICESSFFAITDDNKECYLLKSQKPSTKDGGILVEA